jgi:SPP1 family predicted phage head-tail adaptor
VNPLRPGDCVHRITIEKPNPNSTKDSAGQRLTTFLPVAEPMASIEPISGREEFIAAQRQASTTHIIRFFYGPKVSAIDANHRIRHQSRTFVMDRPPVNVGERNVEFICYCVEGLRTEN